MKEWQKLLWIIGIFLGAYFIPWESTIIRQAGLEAFMMLQDYARQHVLTCLIPAFFIAGAISTGTVATTDNRNWELLGAGAPQQRFSQSRAVALDMESATIAANGFRFRVPYGTLLCVSDKPLHGEIKLPGMANHFYRERVNQHLLIGLRTIERLREAGLDQLHSRKLRSFSEVAFQ